MRVALLIGHRSGKQGVRSYKKISEYSYWYTYLHTIAPLLSPVCEFKVFERFDSDGLGYKERMRAVGKRADEWGADLIISFHFNGSKSPKSEGFEVLCSSSLGSKYYAKKMIDAFDEHLFGDNRGVKIVRDDKSIRGSGFLYRTPMPAILVEPFFGSSYEDWNNATKENSNLFFALEQFFITISAKER